MDIQRIRVDIEEIKGNQNKILETQRESEIGDIIRADFISTNHLILPFNKKESFDEFDLKLQRNENFQRDFVSIHSFFFILFY